MFVDKIIWGNSVEEYIIALSILILFLGAGQIFSKIVVNIIKRVASKTRTTLDDVLVNIIERPAVFAITILGLYISSLYLDFGQEGFVRRNHIFTVLIVINTIWVLNKAIDALVEHYLAPLTNKTKSSLDDHLLPFVRKFLKVIVVLLGILFLLRNLGYDITSLIAGLGIGGLAFALAAQPLLSNLFGGLAIISDKPFQIGDRVKIDQKFEGTIKEIGMRSTVIKTYNDTLIHIPNNIIATTAVENLSIGVGENKSVRFTFNIGLEYDTSNDKIEEAINIIKDILKSNKNVVQEKDLEPWASFTEFKDSSLNIAGGYLIISPSVIGETRTTINLEIKKRLEKAHIHFAFPTHTVHVKKE